MLKVCISAAVRGKMASKLGSSILLRSFATLQIGLCPYILLLGYSNSSLGARRKQASHEQLLVNCTETPCRNIKFQTKENPWFH